MPNNSEETLQGYEKANAKVETCQNSSGFIAPSESRTESIRNFELRRSSMNPCSSLRAVEVIRHLSMCSLWEWCHSLNFIEFLAGGCLNCAVDLGPVLPYFSGSGVLSLCCLPVLFAAKCGDFLPGTIVALDRPSVRCSKMGIWCLSPQPRYIPTFFLVVSPSHEPCFMKLAFSFTTFCGTSPVGWLVR